MRKHIPRANAKPKSKPFTRAKYVSVFGGYHNICLWCETEFDTMRPAKYCHERCRTWAYQARQKKLGQRQGHRLKRQ
jgi:hypothetical protein